MCSICPRGVFVPCREVAFYVQCLQERVQEACLSLIERFRVSFYRVIALQVVLKMHESFGSLKVERFLQLYKAFLIWPNWVSPSH